MYDWYFFVFGMVGVLFVVDVCFDVLVGGYVLFVVGVVIGWWCGDCLDFGCVVDV